MSEMSAMMDEKRRQARVLAEQILATQVADLAQDTVLLAMNALKGSAGRFTMSSAFLARLTLELLGKSSPAPKDPEGSETSTVKASVDRTGTVKIEFNTQEAVLRAPSGPKGEPRKYLPCSGCGALHRVELNVVSIECDDEHDES